MLLKWGIVEGQNPKHHELCVCCICMYAAWKGLGSVCGRFFIFALILICDHEVLDV
jgi:hypothetical protein